MNSQPETAVLPEKMPPRAIDRVRASLPRRYAAERRFRFYGQLAIVLALFFLSALFIDIIGKGYTAFVKTYVGLDIHFDEEIIDPHGTRNKEAIAAADFGGLLKATLRQMFPSVKNRRDKRSLSRVISSGAAFLLRDKVLRNPDLIGNTVRIWLPADDEVDQMIKGRTTDIDEFRSRGTASPTGLAGEIRVLSTANDFTDILARVKHELSSMARDAHRELKRLGGQLDDTEEALLQSTQALGDARTRGEPEQVAQLENRLRALVSDRDRLVGEIAEVKARVEDLQRRADTPGGEEVLLEQMPSYLVAINGGLVKITAVRSSEIAGQVILPLSSLADAAADSWQLLEFSTPESERRLNDKSVAWVWELERQGRIQTRFNTTFFTAGDSRDPEQAGIWGAVVGSFLTLTVTLLLSFPIGVASAVYLEEFAPRNRWTDLIEVNINNLAAVPSIVFGLLGLAMLLNVFGLPRSAPLVGGLVLTLMTLPTIIIASRAALKSVPPSIREGALGVGASKVQMVTDHVLPLALPGMLTGTIIGMAQALGETAPLLMIGMVAFIVDIPSGFADPAAVLPVQIFLWADSPERAFVELTSGAIMVLLGFLITMNAVAVLLRKRFERRW